MKRVEKKAKRKGRYVRNEFKTLVRSRFYRGTQHIKVRLEKNHGNAIARVETQTSFPGFKVHGDKPTETFKRALIVFHT